MKREYTKPESKFVNIKLNGTILDDGIEDDPVSVPVEGNSGLWDEDYDRLPQAESVWGKETEE